MRELKVWAIKQADGKLMVRWDSGAPRLFTNKEDADRMCGKDSEVVKLQLSEIL